MDCELSQQFWPETWSWYCKLGFFHVRIRDCWSLSGKFMLLCQTAMPYQPRDFLILFKKRDDSQLNMVLVHRLRRAATVTTIAKRPAVKVHRLFDFISRLTVAAKEAFAHFRWYCLKQTAPVAALAMRLSVVHIGCLSDRDFEVQRFLSVQSLSS